ncbi:MAG: adenosylcobinamide-GDP ribazoletransferase, partial [Firmicutes bacterium]|nr:adenosylcobinamide-GDP ribazoletransferase [Bacillota bacterium]
AALSGGLLFAFLLARCFGGMTGDTLGAVNELGEVLFLLGIGLLN